METGTDAPAGRTWKRRWLYAFRIRPRLVASILAGLVGGFALPDSFEMQTRLIAGWDICAIAYLAMTYPMMIRSNLHQLRQRAARHDEGEWTIILLSMAATLTSLGAIGVELHQARLEQALAAWRVAGVGVTVVLSWLFIHTILAQHYAHDYYLREGSGPGLLFPGKTTEPNYWDFAYFAFTIGVAAQTADVSIASPRIRRVVLAHAVLAFFFNTAILALTINVAAGLL